MTATMSKYHAIPFVVAFLLVAMPLSHAAAQRSRIPPRNIFVAPERSTSSKGNARSAHHWWLPRIGKQRNTAEKGMNVTVSKGQFRNPRALRERRRNTPTMPPTSLSSQGGTQAETQWETVNQSWDEMGARGNSSGRSRSASSKGNSRSAPTCSPGGTSAPTPGETQWQTINQSNEGTQYPTAGFTNSGTQAETQWDTINQSEEGTMASSESNTQWATQDASATPRRKDCRENGNSPKTGGEALPTKLPTAAPSFVPTDKPTAGPSYSPHGVPSLKPTKVPIPQPKRKPTHSPTSTPTTEPSALIEPKSDEEKTETPTSNPTVKPTKVPTFAPSLEPSSAPPSLEPTELVTLEPTNEVQESSEVCKGDLDAYNTCTDGFSTEETTACETCIGQWQPLPTDPCQVYQDSLCLALSYCVCRCRAEMEQYMNCLYREEMDCPIQCPDIPKNTLPNPNSNSEASDSNSSPSSNGSIYKWPSALVLGLATMTLGVENWL